MPDPAAPATDHLGFERGLRGWIVVGEVEAASALSGVAPLEGSAQAVVHANSSVAAYIDVPAHAQSLHISAARLSALKEMDDDDTGAVALHHPGDESIVGFQRSRSRRQRCGLHRRGPASLTSLAESPATSPSRRSAVSASG